MILEINGNQAPSPITYNVGMMDISKAERNALGNMVLDIITTKTKIELEWGILTAQEASQLFNMIKPAFFQVKYFDPETATYKIGTFYKGDRTLGVALFEGGIPVWRGAKMNFIEQ